MVPEAEMNTAEVILITYKHWTKREQMVAVIVPEAEMNNAEVISI